MRSWRFTMEIKADIGIFGGSGFYSLLDNVEEYAISTPYGKPSDKIAIAQVGRKNVAFMPRHGKTHKYPPHLVPYRANIYAMKQLGVSNIIATTASGSLRADIKPGDFVVCDQFVDRTYGRKDTYFDGPEVKHISAAHPYSSELGSLAISSGEKLGLKMHHKGTVVVVQGPRFSTVAESRWYSKMGWDIINMTQYPECILAKELDINYANISLITDYDAGLEGNPEISPVTAAEVSRVFNENNDKVKALILEIIKNINI